MGKVPRHLLAVPVLVLFGLAAGLAAAQTPAPPPDKVPADFPADCPIYKNATIRDYAAVLRAQGKVGTLLILETQDSKAAAVAFYQRELPANGWKLKKPSRSTPDTLDGSKGGRQINVKVLTARREPNPSTIIELRLIRKE
jgi:hypothetical protein